MEHEKGRYEIYATMPDGRLRLVKTVEEDAVPEGRNCLEWALEVLKGFGAATPWRVLHLAADGQCLNSVTVTEADSEEDGPEEGEK